MPSLPLLPHNLSAAVERVFAEGQERSRTALTLLAGQVERGVKEELHRSSHPRGTPTPAPAGGPPAAISGNLARSITHTAVAASGSGWATKVGTSSAGYYGKWQEQGTPRMPARPFLEPTARRIVISEGVAIWRAAFAGRW